MAKPPPSEMVAAEPAPPNEERVKPDGTGRAGTKTLKKLTEGAGTMNKLYKVKMGDGGLRMIAATGPKAAKWEAERIAIDSGIDEFRAAAKAIRVTKAPVKKVSL